MAVVQDQFIATLLRTPFLKPPDMQRMFTAMPRALVQFHVITGTLSAKPVNDSQELQVIMDLPIEFAYRMVDGILTINQDVANDWENTGYLEVTNAIRGMPPGQVNRHLITATDTVRFSPAVAQQLSVVDKLPTYIMQSNRQGVAAGGPDWRMINLNAGVGAAGTIEFYATFFEYDIEQVQMFPVHFPTLTYARA